MKDNLEGKIVDAKLNTAESPSKAETVGKNNLENTKSGFNKALHASISEYELENLSTHQYELKRSPDKVSILDLEGKYSTVDELLKLFEDKPGLTLVIGRALAKQIVLNKAEKLNKTMPSDLRADFDMVDYIDTFVNRVNNEGTDFLREFGDFKISLQEVMLDATGETAMVSLSNSHYKQLESHILGSNWIDETMALFSKFNS